MIIDEHLRAISAAGAEDLMRRTYRRPIIRDTSEPFVFEQTTTGDEHVSLTRIRVSSPASITVELDGSVGIGHTRSGDYVGESNGDSVDPRAPFVLRPGQFRSWSNRLDLTTVNIDLASLSAHASAHGLTPPSGLRFERLDAASPETSRNWLLTLAHVTGIFNDRNLLQNDVIRRSAIDLVYSAAISAFVLHPSPVPGESAHPLAIRRALTYIDEHAADPIGVADIAAAARMSVRGLQDAFQRNVGTTPTQHLRSIRLSHAHADLMAADPTTDTVSAIAARWGFSHPGRFSTLYRRRYHQLPRTALGS